MQTRLRALIATLSIAGIAACGGAAGATTPPAPTSAASMMDHSPMPSASMMDHSPMPSASMMDHSPMPSASMMDHSPMPSVASAMSSGAFHPVDGDASGNVALYHQTDGSFVVTFENFSTLSSVPIHVILVTNKDVMRSNDVDKSAIVDLGALKAKTGMQDYTVPTISNPMTLHTVVLWDTEMQHAIAAAPLR